MMAVTRSSSADMTDHVDGSRNTKYNPNAQYVSSLQLFIEEQCDISHCNNSIVPGSNSISQKLSILSFR